MDSQTSHDAEPWHEPADQRILKTVDIQVDGSNK